MTETKVAALFVEQGGCYFGLEGVEPWPESRDARLARLVLEDPRLCRDVGSAAMRIAREKGASLKQIGRAFNRHHTTVLHALRKREGIA